MNDMREANWTFRYGQKVATEVQHILLHIKMWGSYRGSQQFVEIRSRIVKSFAHVSPQIERNRLFRQAVWRSMETALMYDSDREMKKRAVSRRCRSL
jgi:hypothetical protein